MSFLGNNIKERVPGFFFLLSSVFQMFQGLSGFTRDHNPHGPPVHNSYLILCLSKLVRMWGKGKKIFSDCLENSLIYLLQVALAQKPDYDDMGPYELFGKKTSPIIKGNSSIYL